MASLTLRANWSGLVRGEAKDKIPRRFKAMLSSTWASARSMERNGDDKLAHCFEQDYVLHATYCRRCCCYYYYYYYYYCKCLSCCPRASTGPPLSAQTLLQPWHAQPISRTLQQPNGANENEWPGPSSLRGPQRASRRKPQPSRTRSQVAGGEVRGCCNQTARSQQWRDADNVSRVPRVEQWACCSFCPGCLSATRGGSLQIV
jgi:hypothetical protein